MSVTRLEPAQLSPLPVIMKSASRCELFHMEEAACDWDGENGAASHSFAHLGVIASPAEHLNFTGKGGGWDLTPVIQSTDVCVPVLKSKLPWICSSVHYNFLTPLFLSCWQQLPLSLSFLRKAFLIDLLWPGRS